MLSIVQHIQRARLVLPKGPRLRRTVRSEPPIVSRPPTRPNTCTKLPFKLEFRTFHTSICTYQTHYEILGIEQTATLAEVTKAYRTKAKQYHPDLNKDPNAQAKFVAVKEAYECLKNSSRRAAYDSNITSQPNQSWTPPRPRSSKGPTYRTAHWDYEADMKSWNSGAQAHRQAHKKQWEQQKRQMDEDIRKASEKDAVRRMLAPYFNVALILSLIAVGCTSLYIQYQSRNRKSTRHNFAPDGEAPTYMSRPYRYQQQNPRESILEDSQSPSLDPHKKYTTRWEDINEALQRRNDFYRQLLTPEDTRPPPTE